MTYDAWTTAIEQNYCAPSPATGPLARWRCEFMEVDLVDRIPAVLAAAEHLRVLIPGMGAELHLTFGTQRRMMYLTHGHVLVLAPGTVAVIRCERQADAAVIALHPCVRDVDACTAVCADGFARADPFLSALGRMLATRMESRWHPGPGFLGSLARVITYHLRDVARQPTGMSGAAGLPPHKLRIVEKLVRARLSGPLQVMELCDAVGMSPGHFSRMFKRATGYSPCMYVALQRVQRAKDLLRTSERTLAEIATAVGLATPRHLAAAFHRLSEPPPRIVRMAPVSRPGFNAAPPSVPCSEALQATSRTSSP